MQHLPTIIAKLRPEKVELFISTQVSDKHPIINVIYRLID